MAEATLVVSVVELGTFEIVVEVPVEAEPGFGAGRRIGAETAAGRLMAGEDAAGEIGARVSAAAGIGVEVDFDAWPMTSASRNTPANTPIQAT